MPEMGGKGGNCWEFVARGILAQYRENHKAIGLKVRGSLDIMGKVIWISHQVLNP